MKENPSDPEEVRDGPTSASMMQRRSFNGKVAVITGGASGIGRSCAAILAQRGARVVIVDRDAKGGARVAEEIDGVARTADVSDPAAMAAIAIAIEAELGPVEFVVCNAGIIQSKPTAPEELSIETWDAIMAVDLRGVYLTCVEFARHMTSRGRGSIVNIASVAGMRSTPLHAYGAAKAAVVHLTTTLAAEWGRSGIRVNTVSPGYVLTPIIEDAIAKGLRDLKIMEENSALGRIVAPIAVARAVAFLLSDEASSITGINLPVDNGWLVTGSWHTYGGIRGPR